MGQAEIRQGFEQFQKRILPAILSDRQSNGVILSEALVQRGYDRNTMTPDEIEQALFKVASLDAILLRLDWKVEPAKLQKMREANQGSFKPGILKDGEDFGTKKREGEKKDAHEATQKDAERQINDMINAFTPVKNGKVDYAVRAKVHLPLDFGNSPPTGNSNPRPPHCERGSKSNKAPCCNHLAFSESL